MITVAKLGAEVGADTSGFDRGMTHADQRVAGAGSKWGKALKVGIGAGLATVGVVAVRGFFGAMNAGLDSLREQQVVVAQTNAAILSTKGVANVTTAAIRDLSTSLETKSGFDDKAIQSGANLLLTFTNIRNEAGAGNDIFNQTTEVMTNMARALGTDASGAAIQLGKALNDPATGLTALRKAGVTFDKQQTERIKKFVKEGKVTEAQKIILAELNKEFGKSNQEFMKTDAGKALLFQDAIEGIQQKLATGMLPAITRVQGALTKFLSDPATMGQVEALGNSIAGIFSEGNLRTAASIMTTAANAIGTVIKLFSGLPKEVQALAVGAVALNKFTGISPLDIAKTVGGAIFARGGTPANPVFVSDVTGGLGGRGGIPPIAGAGGAAAGGFLAPGFATALAGFLTPFLMFNVIPKLVSKPGGDELKPGQALGLTPTANQTMVSVGLGNLMAQQAIKQGLLPRTQGAIGDYGAPHPGSTNAGSKTAASSAGWAASFGQRRDLDSAAILERALLKGFRPTDAAVQATLSRNIVREQERTTAAARRTAAAVERKDPAPSTTVNLTINVPKVQSYIQTIQRTVRYGPTVPNVRRGGPQEFG